MTGAADSGGQRPAAAYLYETLRDLWPEPATITRRRPWSRSGGNQLDFVVLPRASRPTLLIPRRPRRVAAAAVRNYKTSASTRAQLGVTAVGTAVRWGAADLLPDRLHIERSDSGIDHYLAESLSRPLFVSLYIGFVRAVQKPVLQLISPDGSTFAFAKIGNSELTKKLVRSEAQTLSLLATVPWQRLMVPEVLLHSQWQDKEVLVQTALRRVGDGVISPAHLAQAMRELALCRGVETHPLAASPFWARLRNRLAALRPTELTAVLASGMDRLQDAAGDIDLDFGSWHGDFAPWNITAAGERVLVWDWEHFESGVPVGFDAIHHQVNASVVALETSAAEALETACADSAELLAPFGLSSIAAKVTTLAYVCQIAMRYLEDGEITAGTTMGRLDLWLATVLDQQLEQLPRPIRD